MDSDGTQIDQFLKEGRKMVAGYGLGLNGARIEADDRGKDQGYQQVKNMVSNAIFCSDLSEGRLGN